MKEFFMKWKILLLFIGISSLVQIGVANTTACHGFYVGGDIGLANFMNKESHSVNPESHQLSSTGLMKGIFIGYDYPMVARTRISFEVFADTMNFQNKIVHGSNTYKMNQYYNLGLRLLPGYIFTPYTVGHLIFGAANARFKINDNGVYGLIKTSYNKTGFQTGLGLTTALINNFFIRINGLYDIYPSSKNQGVSLSGAGSYQRYKNQFSQLGGELSLYYKG